jgi:diguanylate cyclase (GGDEF)-like protein
MMFHWNEYSTVDIIAATIQMCVAIMALRRRGVPGATTLTLLMLAAAEWSIGGALEYAAVGTSHKVFWAPVEYLGSSSVPVLLLLLAFEYNRFDWVLTRRNIALLFIVPIIAMVLAATNQWHHLIWTQFDVDPAHPNLLIYHHGVTFWITVFGYSYAAIIVGVILFIRAAIQLPSFYRRQTALLLIGTVIPSIGDLLYDMKARPMPGLELGPLGLACTGIILAVAIFRFGLLDIIPVARDTLVETLHDGILVLDNQNRIVDINPAARKLLRTASEAALNLQFGETLSPWPVFLSSIRDQWDTAASHSTPLIDPAHLEITVAPVRNRKGMRTGRLIILHDISVRHAAEQEIRRANEMLRAQIEANKALQEELRELAVRDPLTGLYNRRHMDSTLEDETEQALSTGQSLTVVMIDIDHFKKLNDTYGHKMGDAALQQLGKLLKQRKRTTDIACRFGGEEFLILMPGAGASEGIQLAETIRREFEQLQIQFNGATAQRTLSAGVATFPEDGRDADTLLQAVDMALYAAKNVGRNCVVRALPQPDVGPVSVTKAR